MSLPLSTSAYAKHKLDHHRGQPPKSGLGFISLNLDIIEELPEVQRFIQMVRDRRNKARPGFPPEAMLRLVWLKFIVPERYNVQLLERLRSSPQLLEICGLSAVPSESTLSRFIRLLADHTDLTEGAIASVVSRLHEELPDVGEVISIDATDIAAYGNPRRNPPIDEDAAWGVRTRKGKSSRPRNSKPTENFYGYKAVFLADATHHIPLAFTLMPANTGESPQLPPLTEKTLKTYNWLKPKYLVADRGYDTISNHRFLVDKGVVPIIHLRKAANTPLHHGIYTATGSPTCLGGKEMTYVRTDQDSGKHLYRCPAEGCDRFRDGKRNLLVRCEDSHWEDPNDDLRVIGVVARQSEQWKALYRKRQGVERFFGTAKRSRLLDRHQYLSMKKVRSHIALSTLTYTATMLARTLVGDVEHMRHMRIRV